MGCLVFTILSDACELTRVGLFVTCFMVCCCGEEDINAADDGVDGGDESDVSIDR